MREIKFRAWDEVNYKMIFFEPFDGVYDCEGNTVLEARATPDEYGRTLQPGKKAKIMQYTGLFDKNGKEIYEGDIVKVNGGEPQFEFVTDIAFRRASWRYSAAAQEPMNGFDCEVIGNIYENPGLIGVE